MFHHKIFGIGFPKTGTTSLNLALQELGLSSIHFPVSLQEICDHDGSVNLPVAVQFEKLDQTFRGSKFILTVREIESWLSSCEPQYRSVQEMDQSLKDDPRAAEFIQFFLTLRQRAFGTTFFDEVKFEHAYKSHLLKVKECFSGRAEDLLILDVSSDSVWFELCNFLALPVPQSQFPRANFGGSLVPVLNDEIVKRLKDTDRSLWIVG